MGYIGGRVAGHSGTANKPKKVFARLSQKRPDIHQYGRRNTNTSTVAGSYRSSYASDPSVTRNALLIVLALAGVWWWSGGFNIRYTAPVASINPLTVSAFTAEQTHAYNFLLANSRHSLAAEDYQAAVYESGKALEIAPYGKGARLVLLRALTMRCAKHGDMCPQAEEQRRFVGEMGWLEESLAD